MEEGADPAKRKSVMAILRETGGAVVRFVGGVPEWAGLDESHEMEPSRHPSPELNDAVSWAMAYAARAQYEDEPAAKVHFGTRAMHYLTPMLDRIREKPFTDKGAAFKAMTALSDAACANGDPQRALRDLAVAGKLSYGSLTERVLLRTVAIRCTMRDGDGARQSLAELLRLAPGMEATSWAEAMVEATFGGAREAASILSAANPRAWLGTDMGMRAKVAMDLMSKHDNSWARWDVGAGLPDDGEVAALSALQNDAWRVMPNRWELLGPVAGNRD